MSLKSRFLAFIDSISPGRYNPPPPSVPPPVPPVSMPEPDEPQSLISAGNDCTLVGSPEVLQQAREMDFSPLARGILKSLREETDQWRLTGDFATHSDSCQIYILSDNPDISIGGNDHSPSLSHQEWDAIKSTATSIWVEQNDKRRAAAIARFTDLVAAPAKKLRRKTSTKRKSRRT